MKMMKAMNGKPTFMQLLLAAALIAFSACEDEVEAPVQELEVVTAEDVPADPDGERGAPPSFTFFDLESGQVLEKSDSASTEWDIALSGVTILTNGGISGPGQGSAQIVNGIFENISEAPEGGYSTDSEEALAIPMGSEVGWYTYTGQSGTPTNAILPVPGKVIVLTTGEGNYAKLEILSYYMGNPDTSTPEFADFSTRPAGRYYTFRYIIQTDGSRDF